MSELQIEFDGDRLEFLPGETVSGTVSWRCSPEPSRLELRLFWKTSGRGDAEQMTIEVVQFNRPGVSGSAPFTIELPTEPYSFSGKLISLIWTLELVALPSRVFFSEEIIISPTGAVLDLSRYRRQVEKPPFGLSPSVSIGGA